MNLSLRIRAPDGVWVLSLVSLFMDISSEMIHSLLPLFLISTLGASAFQLGVIEGLAEGVSLIVRIFSGVLSDHFQRRKSIMIVGYGLGAFIKPAFALAGSVNIILAARLIDRIGKGIRVAPRDAMIADIVPKERRGSAFGLRQSMDNIGALIGPLLGGLLLTLWPDDFRAVFWLACIPAMISFYLVIRSVKESNNSSVLNSVKNIAWREIAALGSRFWWIAGLGVVFTLAKFSNAFLILRAQEVGVTVSAIPTIMVVTNSVYALGAYPFGKLSDHTNHYILLSAAAIILIVSNIVLAFGDNGLMVFVGAGLWGLQLAIVQGLFITMIASVAPVHLRGSALGIFGLLTGFSYFFASSIAGALWQEVGSKATFLMSASFAFFALILIFLKLNHEKRFEK